MMKKRDAIMQNQSMNLRIVMKAIIQIIMMSNELNNGNR